MNLSQDKKKRAWGLIQALRSFLFQEKQLKR